MSIHRIVTCGDKDKLTPLSQVEGANFFTKEIDEALLNAEVDVAVHSSKDLPDILPDGLVVLFETKSVSPYDALVSRDNLKFRQLPSGWRIGASSLRRKDEIRALRPDLEIVDVRGNIQERLSLIKQDKVDAVVVAHAALIRLGLEDRISEVFPLSIFQTHPKQGCLSIIVKEE